MPKGSVVHKLGTVNRVAKGLARAGIAVSRIEIMGEKMTFFASDGPVAVEPQAPKPTIRRQPDNPAKVG